MTVKAGKSKLVKKTAVHKAPKKITKSNVKPFKQDSKQTESLIRAGKASAIKAIRESKALELSMTFMEKGILYKEGPDGKKTTIKISHKKKSTGASIILKKGMILYAKG